eukprot:TRINITY_DN6444_c0_g1_i1.p1 TRINITY_DN6444_c0_g1~~TRINITY_DN6444_c0_g1_i1.p1  ORF type:complete len:182 (-),score=13.95 TRINITY_DN6444_c0_g1_i1:144-689(-)
MKSSKMSMPESSDKKMPLNIKKLVGQSLQEVLKLLLMPSYAHGKPLKSECKPQKKELSQLTSEKPSTNLKLKKDGVDYIKVLDHSGLDKFHTPLSNSSLSKPSQLPYMKMSSPEENKTTQKDNNYQLLSYQDILLVSSALSFHTQLIPWSQNYIQLNQEVQSEKTSRESTEKSDSKDYGLD